MKPLKKVHENFRCFCHFLLFYYFNMSIFCFFIVNNIDSTLLYLNFLYSLLVIILTLDPPPKSTPYILIFLIHINFHVKILIFIRYKTWVHLFKNNLVKMLLLLFSYTKGLTLPLALHKCLPLSNIKCLHKLFFYLYIFSQFFPF